jgi:hypothetical protein
MFTFSPRLERLERRDCPASACSLVGAALTTEDFTTPAAETPPMPQRRNLVTLHSLDLDRAAAQTMGNQVWDFNTQQARQVTLIQDL